MTYRPRYTFIFTPISSHQEVPSKKFPPRISWRSNLCCLLALRTVCSIFLFYVFQSECKNRTESAYYSSLIISLFGCRLSCLCRAASRSLKFTSLHPMKFIGLSWRESLHTEKFSLWISHFKVPTVNSSSEQTLSGRSVAYYASNTCRVLIFQLFGFRTEVVDAESELWEVRLLKGRKWEQWKVKNSKILIYFASHRIDDCDSCLLTPLVRDSNLET